MKIIMHVGAHRTASTSFQAYMRQNAATLAEGGLGFWGPGRTRKGLFAGVIPSGMPRFGRDPEKRASGRIQMQLDRAQKRGLEALLISEENMIGSVRANLRECTLYHAIGDRMARFNWAFEDRVDRIVLCIRSHELWWSSTMAYGVARGAPVLQAGDCEDIVSSRRGWRQVITDLACAMPEAELLVLPFERFSGRPWLMLETATDVPARPLPTTDWLNRGPDLATLRSILKDRGEDTGQVPPEQGRWMPFTDAQQAELRALYVDDLQWLSAGADGLATLIDDPVGKNRQESWLQGGAWTDRGHEHVTENERLAQPG